MAKDLKFTEKRGLLRGNHLKMVDPNAVDLKTNNQRAPRCVMASFTRRPNDFIKGNFPKQ